VKVLAEIPAPASSELRLRPGTLRRADLVAYADLLDALGDARAVLVAGEAAGRPAGAVGLATAATAAGGRVALLECDLSRPALADALGLSHAPGLHEYLRGEARSQDILRPVVLAGPGSAGASDALVCVVAGRSSDEAAALLDSERFGHVLRRLRESYELVVIDAPPADAGEVVFTALGAAVDAVLAWAERGASPPELPIPATGLVVQG
jgi:Mrp family chromosome partitioning ATPase